MEILLYSVLGPANYKPIDISYKDCKDVNVFASHHYKRCLEREGKRAKLTYFLPHETKEGVEGILKQVAELLSLDKEDWEKVTIPSFGHSEKGSYRYNTHYRYIVLVILLRMLLDIYKAKGTLKEVLADISQGWNLYVNGLVDALRTVSVFWTLLNYTKPDDVTFKILFADPVIGGIKERKIPLEVHEDQVKVRVWFDFPLIPKKKDLEKIGLNTEGIRVLKNAFRTYRAIKGNAPLVVFTFGYDRKERIDELIENYLAGLWNKYNPERAYTGNGNYEIPEPESVDLIRSVLLSLALYRNISATLEELGVPPNGADSVELEQIERSFIGSEERRGVYDIYGLPANKLLLENDIKSLKKKGSGLLENGEFFICNLDGLQRRERVSERNFWAHSGFEGNITKLIKKQGTLYVKYDPSAREKLQDLLRVHIQSI